MEFCTSLRLSCQKLVTKISSRMESSTCLGKPTDVSIAIVTALILQLHTSLFGDHFKNPAHFVLYMCVIRGRWRLTSASTHHSITCSTGKQYGRMQGKLNSTKPFTTNEDTSGRILDGCCFLGYQDDQIKE
jgi:hypothetical protein